MKRDSLALTLALDPVQLGQKLRIARRLTLLSYALLLGLYTLLNLTRADGNMGWWLMQCVPLLIFIPALIGNHYKAYSWLCFVVLLFYFTAVVPMLMGNPAEWSYWAQLGLIISLFISAMLTSRWRQRQMILQQQEPAA